jgi:sigma-B regulation protein RsbU (phosphoserine phosphatase)
VASDADAVEFYTNAPCGLVLAALNGTITMTNSTMAEWLGYPRDSLVGRRFPELLNAGGRIHYETHFAPLLQMRGELTGITVDLVAADGARIPVFVTANLKLDAAGTPTALRIVVQDGRDRRSYERELLEARKSADRERAQVHELATTLRRSLVPPSLAPPAGLTANAHYHTASPHDVGGDFYDLFPLSRQKWGFFLGDVSGKGAGAAAVTSLTRYTLRAAATYDDDPVQVLRNLNTVLSPEFHNDDPHFCTVIFGVISPSGTGFDVELATGGHPPALLMQADGQVSYVATDGGQVIGMIDEPRFVSVTFHLSPGDTLVLYTDGLTEARTGHTQRFDDNNELLEFAEAHAPTTAPAIVDDFRTLLESFGAGLEDDTAILALGVPATS